MKEGTKSKVLVYGCYGYTGELVVEEGIRRGLPMKLAGRNHEKVEAMARKHHLPFAAFDLGDGKAADEALKDVAVVLHCSGPFIHTWRPMAEACLRNQVHYLDITGEIEVFESLHKLDAQARGAGVQLMPGVGFDVVPTDCLAGWLKHKMPDARNLDLVIFNIGGRISRGTALTMTEGLGEKGMIRRGGKLIADPVGKRQISVDFGRGYKTAVSIPWGDVSTAYHSTGIPDITTYFVLPGNATRMLRLSGLLGWLLKMEWVKNIGRNRIKSGKPGPDESERASSKTLIWGRVQNAKGESQEKHIETPNGYTFTAQSAVHIASKILNGQFSAGFQTPSKAYGFALLNEIMENQQLEG